MFTRIGKPQPQDTLKSSWCTTSETKTRLNLNNKTPRLCCYSHKSAKNELCLEWVILQTNLTLNTTGL